MPLLDSQTPVSSTAPLGEMFGPYRIVEPLGAGAMGAVFRALDVEAGTEVAIKVLHERRATQAVVCERLKREAEVIQAIDHPNVVRVLASGTSPDGRPYLAMELLRGRTLAEVICEGPQGWMRVAHLVRELARGLAAAHDKGFVHRDLKPCNVMVLDGPEPEHIKILDFGIVGMISDPRTRLTDDGMVLGTPIYMSPEQLVSSSVDHRADLYALGIMAYELLTGAPPFDGAFREIAAKHLMAAPAPLPECGGLDILIGQLLAKDATRRPATAHAVVAEIDALVGATQVSLPAVPAFVAGAGVLARSWASVAKRMPRPQQWRRAWQAAAGTGLVAGATVVALAAFSGSPVKALERTDAAPITSRPVVTQVRVSPRLLGSLEGPHAIHLAGPTSRDHVPDPTEAEATLASAAGSVEHADARQASQLELAEAQALEAGAAVEEPPAPPVSPPVVAAAAPARPVAAVVRPAAVPPPPASYETVNVRLREISARLTAAARHGTDDVRRFEEDYLDLSASLEPGLDPARYAALMGRIDALDRALRAAR